jgi:hypothetical protein
LHVTVAACLRAIVGNVAARAGNGRHGVGRRPTGRDGGFGNPLKRLETDRPLTDVVASAVRDALRARGLLGDPGAGYDVQIAIQQFEADQVVRREAKVQLRLTWIRRSNGQPAFVNQGQADIVNGSIINMESGVFGSIEELQKLTAQAMSQAIDQALNDPKLQIFTSATAAN